MKISYKKQIQHNARQVQIHCSSRHIHQGDVALFPFFENFSFNWKNCAETKITSFQMGLYEYYVRQTTQSDVWRTGVEATDGQTIGYRLGRRSNPSTDGGWSNML
jgi:hypothetical protein